jgi:hypothetical protein
MWSSSNESQKQRLFIGVFSSIMLVFFLVVSNFSIHYVTVLYAVLGPGSLAVYMYYRWRSAKKNAQHSDGNSTTKTSKSDQ